MLLRSSSSCCCCSWPRSRGTTYLMTRPPSSPSTTLRQNSNNSIICWCSIIVSSLASLPLPSIKSSIFLACSSAHHSTNDVVGSERATRLAHSSSHLCILSSSDSSVGALLDDAVPLSSKAAAAEKPPSLVSGFRGPCRKSDDASDLMSLPMVPTFILTVSMQTEALGRGEEECVPVQLLASSPRDWNKSCLARPSRIFWMEPSQSLIIAATCETANAEGGGVDLLSSATSCNDGRSFSWPASSLNNWSGGGLRGKRLRIAYRRDVSVIRDSSE